MATLTAVAPSSGKVRVIHGDAYDVLPQLPAGSIDVIITSPPYWGHREYGLGHNWQYFNDIPTVREIGTETHGYAWYRQCNGVLGLEPYPEWYVVHLAEVFDRAKQCLKNSGSLWVNLGDTYFARWSSVRDAGRQGLSDNGRYRRKTPLGGFRQEKQLLMIPARFAIEMQSRGWILRNDVIWYKPNATPRPEGDRLKLAHEHFFHFVKKPKSGRPKYFYEASHTEGRSNDVVIVNAAPGDNGHSATFPCDLIRPRILTSCPIEGTVLDPFSGSGRTLEVALELGRNAVGIDLQRKYVDAVCSKVKCQDPRKKSVR